MKFEKQQGNEDVNIEGIKYIQNIKNSGKRWSDNYGKKKKDVRRVYKKMEKTCFQNAEKSTRNRERDRIRMK